RRANAGRTARPPGDPRRCAPGVAHRRAGTGRGSPMTKRRRRQWGNGSVRQQEGGLWQIRWRENGKRPGRSGFASPEDAEGVLAEVMAEIAHGRAGLPPDIRGVPSLGKLAGPWLDARENTHRAADCDRYRWDKHLEPHFGHLRPNEVDSARIRAFVQAK